MAASGLVPVPAASAPLSVATIGYDLGAKALKINPRQYNEIQGSVYHPTNRAGRPYPLLILVHGAHQTCLKGGQATTVWPCPRGQRPIRSYQGYGYLGRALAARGYVVVSIGVNGIMAAGNEDATGKVVDRHLALWRQWTTRGGAPFGNRFAGLADASRAGLLGHSRGGEGVALYARQRPATVRAALLLAPGNLARPAVPGVPLGVMLPTCDGDIGDLQGVHYYDDARYARAGDPAPKDVFTMRGANHNFFNTDWSPSSRLPGSVDDAATALAGTRSTCAPGSPTRLSEGRQRRLAITHIAGFFDRTFKRGRLASGDRTVLVTDHPGAADRRVINRLAGPGALSRNALGGRVRVTGGLVARACVPPLPSDRTPAPNCLQRYDDREGAQPHIGGSFTSGLVRGLAMVKVRWEAPGGALVNQVPPAARDFSGYRTLRFRTAIDFTDPRNPAGRGQDLSVTLTDSRGHRASVPVAPRTRALDGQPAPGSARDLVPHFLLNQAIVPLSAFRGVDLRAVSSVRLAFDRTPRGLLGLSDLLLGRR